MNFKLVNNPEGLDSLAGAWNSLLAESITNTPFLRYEYLRAWWATRGGGEWPQAQLAVITASQDERLLGVAPCFLARHEDIPALMLLGSIEISDFLDLLVRPADLTHFVHDLFDYISGSNFPLAWRGLDFYNLSDTSPSLAVLQAEACQRGWTFSREPLQSAPYIPLPGDFDAYLNSLDKKQRHELRRKTRRAEESGRNVSWYIVADESRLDEEIDAFLALMSNDPEKADFLTAVMRSQMRAAVHAAYRAGWLQLAFLEVDGEKACGYLNFDYGNKIWVYNSGLDRKFMDLSPGWVLLGYLLEWANQHKRAEFDFMRGNEDYKYRFGAIDKQVVRVRVTR